MEATWTERNITAHQALVRILSIKEPVGAADLAILAVELSVRDTFILLQAQALACLKQQLEQFEGQPNADTLKTLALLQTRQPLMAMLRCDPHCASMPPGGIKVTLREPAQLLQAPPKPRPRQRSVAGQAGAQGQGGKSCDKRMSLDNVCNQPAFWVSERSDGSTAYRCALHSTGSGLTGNRRHIKRKR